MSEQLTLDGGTKPVGRQAPRQDAVIALLRQHPEGCSADEIGAAIHASAGKHSGDSVCQWCGVDAKSVLRALEKKQLVTRTGTGCCGELKDDGHHPFCSKRRDMDLPPEHIDGQESLL